MKIDESMVVEMLAKSAKNLAQLVANSSYEFWQRKDLRLYVDFGNLSQTEQDRMFNELELTILGLFTLHFEHALSIAEKKEHKIVIESLQKELVPAFLQLFVDLGIEHKYIEEWKTLIAMRFKEYRKDFKTAIKESSKWEEFKGDEETLKVAWARIETMTIDCLTHIRRGKVEKDDPLWKLLRKWLISLDAQLNPITSFAQDEQNKN